MKYILTTLFAICIATTLACASLAAEPQEVKLSGSTQAFKYSELTPGQTITVFGVSKGTSTNPVKITLYAPKGTKLSASAAKINGTTQATLSKSKAFYALPLEGEAELEKAQKSCVDFSPGDALSEDEPPFDPDSIKSIWDALCDFHSNEELMELAEALAETYGGSWDVGRACGYIVYSYREAGGQGETPGEPSALAVRSLLETAAQSVMTKQYAALFSKNACGDKRDKYIFKLSIKLPPEIPTSGQLRVRILETKLYGGNEATIKPISDGLYAPQPLLLLNYLGFCGQRISITKWRKDRLIGRTEAKVYDLVQYRDLILTRTPIGKYLTGGEASIELYDRNSGYSACFQLERTRQRVNGYPE